MKTILLALLFALPAQAALLGTPYPPEIDQRFNVLEASSTPTTADNVDGLKVKHYARATWNAATQGTSGTAYSLGVSLPAKAIIQRSFLLSDTTPVSAGNGTLAISCISANDIFSAATAISHTAGTFTEGVSTGTAANMKLGTVACAITATIASASFTAGKEVVFVEYEVDN